MIGYFWRMSTDRNKYMEFEPSILGRQPLSWQGVPKPRYEKDKMDESFKKVREFLKIIMNGLKPILNICYMKRILNFPRKCWLICIMS